MCKKIVLGFYYVAYAINNESNCSAIYQSIYENVITFCIKLIECSNYDLAYTTYKNGVLELEESMLDHRLTKD